MDTERQPTYDELLAENARLREENAQLKLRVAEQDAVIERQKIRIAELEQVVVELNAKIDKLTKMLFGKKSEKSKKKVKTLPTLPKNRYRMVSRRRLCRKSRANAAVAVASRFRRKFRVATCMSILRRTNVLAIVAEANTFSWASRSTKSFITSR
jgi:uncharacterized coiled-coil protein SlyX